MSFALMILSIATTAVASADGGQPPRITYESLLQEMIDPLAIARWPAPAFRCLQASSYDRKAKSPDEDWFANADRGHFIREEKNGDRTEWVMMDAAGPGAVVRIWSANPSDAGTIRIYLDESADPVIETPMEDLLGGTWRLGAPLSAVRARGWNLYLPIPYAKHCKITADQRDFYYHVNYRTYTEPADVETFSMAVFERGRGVLRDATNALRDVGRAFHPSPLTAIERTTRLKPKESLLLDLPSGPYAVREIILRLEGGNLESATRQLVLHASFDGADTVWCPIGHLFGTGLGINPHESWRTSVDEGGVMHARWPMPYAKSGKLTLENTSDDFIDLKITANLGYWPWDDRSMRFHATWRSQDHIDTGEKQDWNFVNITGRGVYAGDVLTVANPTCAWWGEGDEKIYVDGEEFPSHFGTGTEDYYGYAWCDYHFFDAPFHAQPRVDGPGDRGHTTVFRTRALDAIPFTKSLNFDMEILHWRKVQVAYSVATFFYAFPGATHNRLADRTVESLRIPAIAPPMKIANAIEAEQMEIVSIPPDAHARMEGNWHDCEWSGDAQMWFGLRKIGDAVELRGLQALSGPRKIILRASRYPDYGIIAVSVNGHRLGEPIDLWREKGLKHTGPIELGVVTFNGEPPTIRFEIVGKNPGAANTGTYMGIDCIVLEPVTATKP